MYIYILLYIKNCTHARALESQMSFDPCVCVCVCVCMDVWMCLLIKMPTCKCLCLYLRLYVRVYACVYYVGDTCMHKRMHTLAQGHLVNVRMHVHERRECSAWWYTSNTHIHTHKQSVHTDLGLLTSMCLGIHNSFIFVYVCVCVCIIYIYIYILLQKIYFLQKDSFMHTENWQQQGHFFDHLNAFAHIKNCELHTHTYMCAVAFHQRLRSCVAACTTG